MLGIFKWRVNSSQSCGKVCYQISQTTSILCFISRLKTLIFSSFTIWYRWLIKLKVFSLIEKGMFEQRTNPLTKENYRYQSVGRKKLFLSLDIPSSSKGTSHKWLPIPVTYKARLGILFWITWVRLNSFFIKK